MYKSVLCADSDIPNYEEVGKKVLSRKDRIEGVVLGQGTIDKAAQLSLHRLKLFQKYINNWKGMSLARLELHRSFRIVLNYLHFV